MRAGSRQSQWIGWLSWLIGAAMLAAVIIAARHFSEGQRFLALAARAKPWWFVLAVGLQALTYVAQGEIFRRPPHAAGCRIRLAAAYELSLAKLFLDQALPSGGLSSAVLVTRALAGWSVPRAIVAATVLINLASYQAAYVLCLLIALAIATIRGQMNLAILLASALFIAFSLVVAAAALALPGSRIDRWTARIKRLSLIERVTTFVKDADADLARNWRVVGEAIGWQVVIVLLDAATIWVLIRSLGATASATIVFASFMVSSVFRTLGLIPVGPFEASSVWTLKLMGVPIPIALASTLLFRGLSFWLPMLPGLWISRRMTK